MASTSTIEIENTASSSTGTGMSNTTTNLDRFNEANTKIFVDRRNSNKFTKVDDVLENMVEFNKNLSKYLNDNDIHLNPINYSDTSDFKFDIDDIAEQGYSNYKSFNTYITENISLSDIEKIKKNGYDIFMNTCFPIIKIVFNKAQYFNVIVLKNGKYTNEKGYGERLILLINEMETKYMLKNQDERDKLVTPSGIKLKDIMPNLSFDVNQPKISGKKSILALQYIEDIYKIIFGLFKDEIIALYKESNKISSNKKLPIDYLNSSGNILFKDNEYTKTDPETSEKTTVQYTVYELKLLGKPTNYLQTLITNYTESNPDSEMMTIYNKSINLDNIKEALPRGSLLTAFVNFESITIISGKTLYLTNKAYQIDAVTKHIVKTNYNTTDFDYKKYIQSLQKKDVKEFQIGTPDKKIEKQDSDSSDKEDEEDEENEDN